MYANQQYGAQYAFLRSYGKQLMLIVVNFDDVEATLNLTIPAHAFDYLGIEEKAFAATELLTGQKRMLEMKRDAQVELTIEPRSGLVLKM